MKPQTGILISAHSYSTVFTVLLESECTINSHTGVFVMKVPDIRQYIYTSLFYVTSLGRGSLVSLTSRVSPAGGETVLDDDGPS